MVQYADAECFKLNGINYDNYLILCTCLEDKKMWLIPYKNITGNQSIKISAKSKYNHLSGQGFKSCLVLVFQRSTFGVPIIVFMYLHMVKVYFFA